jgi:hypothetical protein
MATIALTAQLIGEKAAAMPRIAGTRTGPLIVVGTGRTMWADLAALDTLDADVMAINMAGVFLPRAPQHWASLHGEKFQWWIPLMHADGVAWNERGFSAGPVMETHSYRRYPGVKHVWPDSIMPPTDGGSGLAGIRAGLAMGYAPLILAGMPIDDTGHFYDPPGRALATHGMFLAVFRQAAKHEFRGRVRSMSGATRELVGAPC